MKGLKQADFFLQLGFLLLTGIAFITNDAEDLNPIIFVFGITFVQLVSIIVHTFAGAQPWKLSKWIKIHFYGILAIIALLIIATIQSSEARTGDKDDKYSMAGLGTMVFAAIPAVLLVLYYIIITWKEWRLIKNNSA
ncbi:MAG: hypothetical protein IPH18_13690 [Chitinophagaceae bacterium]|nr:hypothetical protein [Chitinophagaceae bacterium]